MLTAVNPYDESRQLKEVIVQAQDILLKYIVPDGIKPEEAIGELISLLDNAETMELLSKQHYQDLNVVSSKYLN